MIEEWMVVFVAAFVGSALPSLIGHAVRRYRTWSKVQEERFNLEQVGTSIGLKIEVGESLPDFRERMSKHLRDSARYPRELG